MAELEIKPTVGSRIRVTAVVASGVFISGILVFLLSGSGKDFAVARATIYTYLPEATGLTTSSEVRASGIVIGSVAKIELSGLLDPQKAVRVDMKVGGRYLKNIPRDSVTSISTDTLVGPAFVSIAEGKNTATLQANGTLISEPLKQAQDRADQVAAFKERLAEIDQIVQQVSSPDTPIGAFFMGDSEYRKVLAEVSAFERSMRNLVSAQSVVGGALFSDALYNHIREPLLKTDKALAEIQQGQGSAGRLFASDEQYNALVKQMRDLHNVLAELNAGRGQFGTLLRDEAVHRQIQTMLQATDALLTSMASGKGKAADLLRNPQVYETLSGSLRDIAAMMKDFHENPKKYLRYKPGQ